MAALVSLFFFSSCGKDSPFDVSDIVGAWSLYRYSVSGSELIMDSAGSVIEVTIVSLTEDELSFSFVEDSAEMTYWFRRI